MATLGRNPVVSKKQIQPEYGDGQADAGRDGWTRLARPNFQARTGTREYSFLLFDWPRAGLATLTGRSILWAICDDHTYIHTCIHIARVWINRVRLPILLMVSWTGKINISLSAFASENLVSRDGFGSLVPRQLAHLHTQAESRAYLRDSSRVSWRHPFICLKPPYAIGSVPSLSGHENAYRWRSLPRVRRHGASRPQGSSERVLPCLAGHLGPINMRLSFPHPLLVWSGHVESS